MNRVNIQPALIHWACQRSGRDEAELAESFPKLEAWKAGEVQPTMDQLEKLAKATLTPLGYFFLPEPPPEKMPLPDFRTVGNRPMKRASAALLETIYAMQRRQDWLREELQDSGEEPLSFVGSVTVQTKPASIAREIRESLGMVDGWARAHPTWESALVGLRRATEAIGVVVVVNGVVGNNTHQKLNPEEFRGFVLCDPLAPLVFLNGADAKSAQMFTLVHELAHLWVGKDGVFNLPELGPSEDDLEIFCNKVAAEVLIPSQELIQCWFEIRSKSDPFQIVARRFKVSPLVAARRALDCGLIERGAYLQFLKEYQERERERAQQKSGGGDFYMTQESRIGRRFGLAVVRAAKAGRLLFRDAYRLTGLSGKTFGQYAEHLGIHLA